MLDAYANFAISTVATAPSPATSGTTLAVQTGHGSRLPVAPFNASVWPSGSAPDPTNAEIVRVTNVSGDTLTITRAQESTTARSIGVGDVIAATITAKTLNDILDLSVAALPSSPVPGQTVLSRRMRDITIPPGIGDRRAVIDPGGGNEGQWVQEPQVWFDSTGKLWMLYTGGIVSPCLLLASCPAGADPLVTANWTKYNSSAAVIGNGAGGQAGIALHPGIYVEGATVYCYYTENSTGKLRCATSLRDNPTTWADQGIVLDPANVSGSISPLANPHVLKNGSTYHMWFEVRDSTSGYRWQIGHATASSPTGTFVKQLYPVTGLGINNLTSGKDTASNPFVTLDADGVYTAWFHGCWGEYQISGVLPTEVYSATSADGEAWTLRDNGYPLLRRAHPYEVDQVADVCFATSPVSGTVYAFWSGNDNATSKGHILAVAATPRMLRYDNGIWVAVDGDRSPGAALTHPYRGFNQLTGGDFTTTTAAGNAVAITGLGFTTIKLPYNARLTITGQIVAKTSVAGRLTIRTLLSPAPYTGLTTVQNDQRDMAADTYRTFTFTHVVDISANTSYALEFDVINAQTAGTTTTVLGTSSVTNVSVDSRPI